jgi:hypothetical protein
MKSKVLVLFVIVGLLCALLPSTTHAVDQRYYLGTSVDRCKNDKILTIWDERGFPTYLDGNDSAWVFVNAKRFSWWCNDSREWTTGPDGTRWIYVVREPNRKITWSFFW